MRFGVKSPIYQSILDFQNFARDSPYFRKGTLEFIDFRGLKTCKRQISNKLRQIEQTQKVSDQKIFENVFSLPM